MKFESIFLQGQKTANDVPMLFQKGDTLLAVLAFLICWLPFGWVYSIPLLGIKDNDPTTTPNVIPLLMVKFGCAMVNPLTYGFENSEVMIGKI